MSLPWSWFQPANRRPLLPWEVVWTMALLIFTCNAAAITQTCRGFKEVNNLFLNLGSAHTVSIILVTTTRNGNRGKESEAQWRLPLWSSTIWSLSSTRFRCLWLQVSFFSASFLIINYIATVDFSCSICVKKQNKHFIVPERDFKLLQVHMVASKNAR